MVIKNQGEAIRQRLKWEEGCVVEAGAAVHEDQRIALADDFDEKGYVPNGHGSHWLLLLSMSICWILKKWLRINTDGTDWQCGLTCPG
jgi:hypothetical protein